MSKNEGTESSMMPTATIAIQTKRPDAECVTVVRPECAKVAGANPKQHIGTDTRSAGSPM